MPTNDQAIANLRILLAEARDLCEHAETRRFGTPASESVAPGFRGPLAKPFHAWLARAESAVVATKTPGMDLVAQLRCLVDAANVAILRGAKNPRAWAEFRSLAIGAEQSAASAMPPIAGHPEVIRRRHAVWNAFTLTGLIARRTHSDP